MKSLADTLAGGFSNHAFPPTGNGDSAPCCRPARRKGPRRLEIEAQERSALARAYTYAVDQATRLGRPQAELDAIEREFEQRYAAGPDFTRYRKGSDNAPPPRHGLDGNAIAKLRHQFNGAARASSKQRGKGKHRGLISRTCKDVFNAVLDLAKVHGALFPSYAKLAELADCSVRSVATAIAALEVLGWITKHRRIKKVMGLLGMKAEQTSNAYEIHPPRDGRGALAWLFSFKPKSECNSFSPTLTACLSYLVQHPETWGSPGIAPGDAYGEPPKAAHF